MFKFNKKRDKKEGHHEGKKIRSLEASIVGGSFERYSLIYPLDLPLGSFIFVKTRAHDKEILVKVRGYSDRKSNNILEGYKIAPPEKVRVMMTNMVRQYFYANKMLDIRIVGSEINLNEGHLKIEFIADKKYSLAKVGAQLASILHVRVDFKQIGARDYARVVGGIGPCGRELCCSTFLKKIPSVTLDMAREQYLYSAPERLSGVCGRLLCCLRYELDFYREMKGKLPEPGQMVKTDKGIGKVLEVNALVERFTVIYEDGTQDVIYLGEGRTWQPA